jgi:hypothetical protein
VSILGAVETVANPLTKYKWIAAAVAIVLWHIAYGAFWNRHGKLGLQHEFDTAKAEANAEARHLEQARQSAATDALRVAAAREIGIRADADRARSMAGGLRDDLSAVRLHSQESRSAADATVSALADVFGECSRAYSELAEQADRATSEALTLRQAWPK